MLSLLGNFMNRTLSRRPVLCQFDFTRGSHKPSSKDHNKRWHFCKNINMDILEAQRITKEVNLSLAKVNSQRREPGTSLWVTLMHTPYVLGSPQPPLLPWVTGRVIGPHAWKQERKKNNSGRAVGQKQARKMSTRQNDATSIKMMLLSMIALGRWWCWWWATTPSQCILTVREKLRAQTSLQILGCCPNFFDPSFPPLENWNNSTHLVRMLEWINEDLPRTPAPRRHKISGSY